MERIVQVVTPELPQKQRRLRVAAYARVSTGADSQLRSLAQQAGYYTTLIKKNPEWQLVGIYADEAQTGTKDSREEFQRLLTDCRAGKIDMVITKAISRFARNTVTLLETVRELKSLSVDVYFEEQNIHTIGSDGELLLTLLASFAQEESLSTSENIKWNIRHGFEKGKLIQSALYGYTIKKGVVSINEEQAQIVREIFTRVANGEAFSAIARDLNNRGVPTYSHVKWTYEHITNMITNEKYKGDALLQKTYVNNHIDKKRKQNKGELKQYYVEGSHPAIVSKELFALAYEKAEAHKPGPRSAPQVPSPFSGKVFCGVCGAKMWRVNGTPFWRCSTHERDGSCQAKTVPEAVLLQAPPDTVRMVAFGNTIQFILKNGETITKKWINRTYRLVKGE